MNTKERYKQLKKENDELLSYLSESYKKIGTAYLKKARGYAVKSLDTEVRIKEVLEELTSFDEKSLDANIVISNMTEYIESNINKLSKAPKSSITIKEVIAVSLFIAAILAYFAFDLFLNKKTEHFEPTNIEVSLARSKGEDVLFIKWDYNQFASDGYDIEIYENGNLIKPAFHVDMMIDSESKKQYYLSDVIYHEDSIYEIKIVVRETEDYNRSKVITFKWPY